MSPWVVLVLFFLFVFIISEIALKMAISNYNPYEVDGIPEPNGMLPREEE